MHFLHLDFDGISWLPFCTARQATCTIRAIVQDAHWRQLSKGHVRTCCAHCLTSLRVDPQSTWSQPPHVWMCETPRMIAFIVLRLAAICALLVVCFAVFAVCFATRRPTEHRKTGLLFSCPFAHLIKLKRIAFDAVLGIGGRNFSLGGNFSQDSRSYCGLYFIDEFDAKFSISGSVLVEGRSRSESGILSTAVWVSSWFLGALVVMACSPSFEWFAESASLSGGCFSFVLFELKRLSGIPWEATRLD